MKSRALNKDFGSVRHGHKCVDGQLSITVTAAIANNNQLRARKGYLFGRSVFEFPTYDLLAQQLWAASELV